jgi:hypothetical protein
MLAPNLYFTIVLGTRSELYSIIFLFLPSNHVC